MIVSGYLFKTVVCLVGLFSLVLADVLVCFLLGTMVTCHCLPNKVVGMNSFVLKTAIK